MNKLSQYNNNGSLSARVKSPAIIPKNIAMVPKKTINVSIVLENP